MARAKSSTTLPQVAEQFDQVDGIETNRSSIEGSREGKFMVKVMDESAVGEYFKLTRELPVDAWDQTRNCFDYTVLDSWVTLE